MLIATKTRNLQDQIYLKDLPRLRRSIDFRATLLKGRENYVCRSRLAEAAEGAEMFATDSYYRSLRYLDKFDRLHRTGDLEAAESFLARYGAKGRQAIGDARALDDICTSMHRYQCRYYRAISEAEKSQVIVANHHLALLWPEWFPDIDRVVIDEAHMLEDSASDVYGSAFSTAFLFSRLARLSGRRARAKTILGSFLSKDYAEFELGAIADRAAKIRRMSSSFDGATADFLGTAGTGRRRIKDSELSAASWLTLVDTARALATALRRLSVDLEKVVDNLDSVERLKPLSERLQRAAENFLALREEIEAIFVTDGVPGTVLWYECRVHEPSGRVTFRRTPLDIGPAIREYLYDRFRSVVLTSATMQSCGSFSFLEKRLGIVIPSQPRTEEEIDPFDDSSSERIPRYIDPVSAGHPFDYPSCVLLCLLRTSAPLDEPSLASVIFSIASITRGRMLALFTNKARMLSVADLLSKSGLHVLAQHRDGGRHELMKALRETPGTVLLGTRSFWEGVDVPGENLSIVVMEKIPFTSPGEPIYDARCEILGSKWFMEYALPSALLTLRQGFGRLIRTEYDRGVVVILDPGKRSYLAHIRRTLPDCTTVEGGEPEIFPAIGKFFAS